MLDIFRFDTKKAAPQRQEHISLQISAQDVAVTQAFVECIDSVFETITGFLDLVNGDTQFDEKYLLNMNEIVIQSLNTFGVTCKNYKSDKRLMSIGKQRVTKNWSKLGNEYQQNKQYEKYVKYMRQALAGKKMRMYPLVKRSEKQKTKDLNNKTVNEAMSHMIGGNCRVNQRNKEVKKDFMKFDKKHEAMYRKGNKSYNNKKLVNTRQALPNEMICVPGVNTNAIQFEQENNGPNNGRNNCRNNGRNNGRNTNTNGCCNHSNSHSHSHSHNVHNEYKQTKTITNTTNTFLVQNLGINDNVVKYTIKKGTPVLILRSQNGFQDIQICDPCSRIFDQVPSHFLCDPNEIDQVRQAEIDHIMTNGNLGYASILDKDQQQDAIKQHKDTQKGMWGN